MYLVPLFMWIAEGHHFSHVGISVQSLFAITESVTDWLRLEGLCRASCPTPTVFQTQFLRQVMLWLNELERGCCCQRCVSRMAGTAPEQLQGRRLLEQEFQDRPNPGHFPAQRPAPGRRERGVSAARMDCTKGCLSLRQGD